VAKDPSAFIDPEIEASLLAGILQGKEEVMVSGILPHLKGSFFNVPAYQWLVDQILSQRSPPAKPILNQLIHELVDSPDEREKYKETLLRLYDLEIDWYADSLASFRRFLSFQAASSSARRFFESFSRTRNVELALRDLQQGVQEAEKVLSSTQIRVIDYAKSFVEREEKRKFRRDNPDLFPKLKLGIEKFDAQIKMEVGTVTNFLAPIKRYKSVILTTCAYAGLLQGFNVALVVVENTVDLTMNRLDSMFTQINYERVVSALKVPEEEEYAQKLFTRLNGWPQRLKVIKGEPHSISVTDVERELRVLEKLEGFVADVKIYDYLNIMKPSNGEKADDHIGQAQLVWDLQNVAKTVGKESIVVTATQSNMEGAGVDKEGKPIKIKQHHQGRALAIAQAVDATIGVDIEQSKSEGSSAQPPQIILSPLYIRDGAILFPEIRLVSEIDRMCLDREIKRLWEEVEDGDPLTQPPGTISR